MKRLSLVSGLLATVLVPLTVQSQSVTILSNNADARDCYANAQMAIAMPSLVASSAHRPCDLAMELKDTLLKRDRVAVYVNRGIIFMAQERYNEALADYRDAYKLDPQLPETHVNLGNLYLLADKPHKAIEFYNEALNLGIRKAHVAYLNRGMVKERLGQLHEAEADYRKALDLSPEWPLAQQKLARVLDKQSAAPPH